MGWNTGIFVEVINNNYQMGVYLSEPNTQKEIK